jgi:hypothetical protein
MKKVKVNRMLNRTILAMASLLVMVNLGAAAVSVNETVGNYRISFENSDNTSMIIKGWNLQTMSDFSFNEIYSGAKVTEVLGVGTLDTLNSPNEFSIVGVLIFNKSVNTTGFETEVFGRDSSRPYGRIYDKTIDGHNGIYAKTGDGPNDPEMERIGLYWLDEADDGTATELVLILNILPRSSEGIGTESTMMTVLNTVHVEKI